MDVISTKRESKPTLKILYIPYVHVSVNVGRLNEHILKMFGHFYQALITEYLYTVFHKKVAVHLRS